MKLRRIGSLQVTELGIGCNQFGVTRDATQVNSIVAAALDSGVTFFDTADEYGSGRSEELLGRALAGRRDEVVIATKVGSSMPGVERSGGASRLWIRAAAEDSLRRLATDRIDILQVHYWDASTPIEETLSVLNELREEGKILEFGCCNFSPAQLTASASGFASAQLHLNLLRKRALHSELPAAVSAGMAVIPYYPLASGLLTGKYKRNAAPELSTRMALYPEAAERMLISKNYDRIEQLTALAEDAGISLVELAIAWLLALPAVATVIAGASSPAQVATNALAAQEGSMITPEVLTAAAALVDA